MARRKGGQKVDGWLVVDKPLNITSTQVVGRVRRLFNAQKVGHGGTLDPLATGILPIALGEATKTVAYAMDGSKRYRFTLRWGQATTTDDAEGPVIETSEVRPSAEQIRAVLPQFVGEISQVPPRFSAVKVEGQRAYDLARADEAVELTPRIVRIDELTLLEQPDSDHAAFGVRCGKGAYMRALARDLGKALGTVAHVVQLRRIAVGPFTEAGAISLDSLEALGHGPALLERLLPVETALDDIPALALTGREADRLKQGRPVPVLRSDNRKVVDALAEGATLYAMAEGKPVALLTWDGALAHPLRLFNL